MRDCYIFNNEFFQINQSKLLKLFNEFFYHQHNRSIHWQDPLNFVDGCVCGIYRSFNSVNTRLSPISTNAES